MLSRFPLLLCALLPGSVLIPVCAQDQPDGVRVPETSTAATRPEFEKHIRPVFQRHCLKCHGPEKQASSLRLDQRSSLLRGGDTGEPPVVPGKSGSSFLVTAISGADPDFVMPPEGPRLTAQEIATIRTWIDQGAQMPGDGPARLTTDHWSFQAPVRSPVPPADDPFVSSPIDAFVWRKLVENKLTPSSRASRRTLIRRLFFVMHGLPPTQEQIRQFVESDSPDAWKTLVETVLQSPRYGERWARHWLDLVRFGETHGFETNRERPHAWPYRDYIIQSLNEDKPYDQFVREQIAGDAIDAGTATGFLVAGPHDLVKSRDINLTLMQRQDELADLINATGTTFLGLTLGCARCHNHKFDPITQRDYYSIQAVFAGVQHADRKLPETPERTAEIRQIDERIQALRKQLAQFIPDGGDRSRLRPPVTARLNVEEFAPVSARFIRFTVEATNSGEPCLDELEVFSDKQNVALADSGVKPTSSGNLPGYEIHKLEHIHDNRYGNGRSWISNEKGKGWVQLELPRSQMINRIVWARDRLEKYTDRLAVRYRIEVALVEGQWQTVASSADRKPFSLKKKSDEPDYDFQTADPKLAQQGQAWLSQVARLKQQRATAARASLVYAGTFSQPGPTHRLYRGDPLAKREEVGPDALEVIGTLNLDRSAPEQERRLRFADWLASRDNPLTARVLVNRLWQHHFGTGLVDTPSDFGANGTPATHPRLLDWLALEFIENGWSLKHMHRLILLSNTWQQDSRPRRQASTIDAASRFLWRFPPRRLEAEPIRDSVLATSGVLDLRMGGPGFSGFEVQMENVRHFFPKKNYGPADWRRMVYMTKVRQEHESVFGAFDCPDGSQVMARRSRSTTPLQALNLLNSSFVIQQSDLFARRLETACPQPDSDRVDLAFRLAFGRPASHEEVHQALQFASESGWPALCRALLNSNEFLFIP